jgi:hypothetical protein
VSHLDCIKDALAPAHWNEARRDFFARFLVALLTAQTACLYRLASLLPSEAQIASRYQRIRRFFGYFAFEEADFLGVVLGLAHKAGICPPYVLAFDRTEWHLGKSVVNVFMLGIVVGKVAFPLTWMLLDKAGSSNTRERIALLEKAVVLLGKHKIAFVIGDREFASEGLLAWLCQEGISFRLRLRQDYLITNGHNEAVCGDWLFRRGRIGKVQALPDKRWCLGHALSVSGMRFRNERGEIEFLIVVSDVPAPLSDYGLRWGIENLFSGLKSRGFDLEATHLLQGERLSRLLCVLAIAFCWCVTVGIAELAEREQGGKVIHKKGLGRLAKSALRCGVDTLRSLLAPLCGSVNPAGLRKAIRFLYGT